MLAFSSACLFLAASASAFAQLASMTARSSSGVLGSLVLLRVGAGYPIADIVEVGGVGLGEVGGGNPEFGLHDPGLVRVLGGHGDGGGDPLIALVDLVAEFADVLGRRGGGAGALGVGDGGATREGEKGEYQNQTHRILV